MNDDNKINLIRSLQAENESLKKELSRLINVFREVGFTCNVEAESYDRELTGDYS